MQEEGTADDGKEEEGGGSVDAGDGGKKESNVDSHSIVQLIL